MGLKNRFISDEQAVPVFKSDIFDNQPEGSLATVNLGYGIYPQGVDEELFRAYLRLRKNVYVDQTDMLPASVELPDGTELDADDERSQHIAVVEKRERGRVALVACIRAIQKMDASQPLPIEHFFSEAFSLKSAPEKSIEISRFISRGRRRSQLRSIADLFTTTLAHVDHHELGPVYGVVEEDLERSLSFFGAPPIRIAEPKQVSEYNDINLGVRIDTDAMKARIGEESLRGALLHAGEIKFWGKELTGVHR